MMEKSKPMPGQTMKPTDPRWNQEVEAPNYGKEDAKWQPNVNVRAFTMAKQRLLAKVRQMKRRRAGTLLFFPKQRQDDMPCRE